MCRSKADGGRRCPACMSGARRSAAYKAAKAAREARGVGKAGDNRVAPNDGGDVVLDAVRVLRDHWDPDAVREIADHSRRLTAEDVEGDWESWKRAYPDFLDDETPEGERRVFAARAALAIEVGAAVAREADSKAVDSSGSVDLGALERRVEESAKASREAEERSAVARKELMNASEPVDLSLAEDADRADAVMYAAWKAQKEAKKEYKRGVEESRRLNAESMRMAYLDALRQVRDFGIPEGSSSLCHKSSVRRTAALVDGSADYYPTEWNRASLEGPPLVVRGDKKGGRGSYQSGYGMTAKRNVPLVMEPSHQMLVEGEEGVRRDRFTMLGTRETLGEDYPDAVRQYKEALDKRLGYLDAGLTTDVEAEKIREECARMEQDGAWVPMYCESRRTYGAGAPKGRGWVLEDEGRDVYKRLKKYKVAKWRKGDEMRDSAAIFVANGDSSNATHELGHRMQNRVPGLSGIEVAYLERRSRGCSLEKIYDKKKRDEYEMGYADSFPVHYMGKVYADSTYREVLTVGMEGVMHNRFGGLRGGDGYREDQQTRAFILGLLATA